MNARATQFHRSGLALCAASALFSASAALAAGGPSEAQQRYLQERARCESGQSHQDRATCLKEAGAAYAEAKRGRLDDGAAPYRQNALARCEVLPPDDRSACRARIEGAGVTSGSVEGGGIYRELVIREGG